MFDVRCSMFNVGCVVLYCDECRYDTSGSSSLYGNGNGETGPVGLGGGNVEKATAGLDPLPLLSRRGRRPSIWHECSQWCDVRRVDAQAMRLNKARNQHPFSF